MGKVKKILLIAIFTLAILVCEKVVVKATTTVNTEQELIDCMDSTTESECKLGSNITIAGRLTVDNGEKTIDLNGKTLTAATKAIEIDEVTLNMKDSVGTGKFHCPNDYGFFVHDDGTVVIDSGTYESKYAVLTGNNSTGDMSFIVNGGTITAQEGPAIYMPGQDTLKITNGTLNGGINARMGQVTISGGTINNTNAEKNIDKIEDYYSYEGNIFYDSAIVFKTGVYTSDNVEHGNSLDVKITGGTFNSTIGNALSVYGLGKVSQDINIVITGGTFNGKDVDVGVYDITKESYVTNAIYKAVTNENKLSISGGNYKHSVADYVKEGYIQNQVSNGYVVKENKVLDCTDPTTGETVKFESDKLLDNSYQLVVANKTYNDVQKATLKENIETKLTNLYTNKNTSFSNTNLIKAIDISIKSGDVAVGIAGTDEYKISVPIDANIAKQYNTFKVAYINGEGVIEKLIDAEIVNNKIVWKTTHLSTYAIVGYNTKTITPTPVDSKTVETNEIANETANETANEVTNETTNEEKKETTNNPKTGDNIAFVIMLLTTVIIGKTISTKIKNNK